MTTINCLASLFVFFATHAALAASGEIFTSFERALDAISGTPQSRLQQLDALEDQLETSALQLHALLQLHRCSLQSDIDKSKAHAILERLMQEAKETPHSDFHVAIAMCDGLLAEKKGAEQNFLSTGRAWQHLSSSSSAMLRYWVASSYARDATLFWRPETAAMAASQALAIARANQDLHRTLLSLSRLALAQADMALYEEAIQNIDDAIRMAGNQTEYDSFHLNRGYILLQAERLDEAKLQYERAAERAIQVRNPIHRITAESNLVEILARSGKSRQALMLADALIPRIPPDEGEILAFTHVFRGVALLELGRSQEAERSFQAGQGWFLGNGLGMSHAINLGFWADALFRQGKYLSAFKFLKQKESLLERARRHIREREATLHKASFDLEKKDREIFALNQANKLQKLEIENRALQEQRLLVVGAVACISLAIAIWFLGKLRKRAKQLDWRGTHDNLTGLFNRFGFHQFLAGLPKSKDRDGDAQPVLLLIDIDHFKRINDGWGHNVGDIVLQQIARRLALCVRKNDCICRWGGEEFLIYVDSINREAFSLVVQRILECVREAPVVCDTHGIRVTISVGYSALFPGQEWSNRLALADQALYAAKQAGRNQAKGHLRDDDLLEWD